jgi:hypothetical protein
MITRYLSQHREHSQRLTRKQRVGYAILGLYIAQIVIGVFIHSVRVPFLFIFHRPPQNYLHAILGLVILAMAGYQVRPLPPNVLLPLPLILLNQIHDGIYTEWPFMTANIPPVSDSAKHAWLALLIVSRASD